MQILLTSANAQDLLLLVFHFNNTDNYIRTEPGKKRRTPQMDLETFLFNRKQLNFHKMFRIRRLVFVVVSRYTLNECMGNFWLYMFEWARVVYIYMNLYGLMYHFKFIYMCCWFLFWILFFFTRWKNSDGRFGAFSLRHLFVFFISV